MNQNDLNDSSLTNTGPVLVLDPDKSMRAHLRKLLLLNGFDVHTAAAPGEALEAMIQNNFWVILTEANFPGRNTAMILQRLREQEEEPVIIVHSNLHEPGSHIRHNLGKIFEYLQKPAPAHEIIGQIKKAALFFQEKHKHIDFFQRSKNRARHQLEWLLWQQQQKHFEKIHFGIDLISSIKHSLTQGMGVGALVTMIELLEMNLDREPRDQNKIDELLQKIIFAGKQVNTWLSQLENISSTFTKKYTQEEIEGNEIKKIVNQSLKDVADFQEFKNQKVIIEKLTLNRDLIFSRNLFSMILRELLTNAFKYSPDESSINIALTHNDRNCALVVLNDIIPGSKGIPRDSENYIFEPFYRISNIYDERYISEEFGLGIGLTVIRNAINHFGGQLYIYEVNDYATAMQPRKRIAAELIIPLKMDNAEDDQENVSRTEISNYLFRNDQHTNA